MAETAIDSDELVPVHAGNAAESLDDVADGDAPTDVDDALDADRPVDADDGEVEIAESPQIPDPSGRLRPDEVLTAQRLLGRPEMEGRSLVTHPHDGYEFIDDLGNSYDAMGTPRGYQYWNEEDFMRSIVDHLSKQDAVVVIDLTGASVDQIASIRAYVDSLAIDAQTRIVTVGG